MAELKKQNAELMKQIEDYHSQNPENENKMKVDHKTLKKDQ